MSLITISSGTTVSGTVVSSGDTLDVFGTGVATLVGGSEIVESGGLASSSTVFGSASEDVLSGGRTISTIVDQQGIVNVFSGGTTTSTIVSGDIQVASGGVASGTVIDYAGSATNSGAMVGAVAVTVSSRGGATIDNFGTISGTGGTSIELGDIQGLSRQYDRVVVESGSTVSGAIADFMPGYYIGDIGQINGDQIILKAVPWSTSNTSTFSHGTLTVSGGGTTEALSFTGIPDTADFLLSPEAGAPSGGGTRVEVSFGTPFTGTGAIDKAGDKHAYEVQLGAGQRYAFYLDGYDVSSSYTLRDPYLQLFDLFGHLLAISDDINSANWSSEIDYTTTTGGFYYLEASSSPSDGTYTTGSYSFHFSTPTPLTIGAAVTDYEVSYVGDKRTYQVTLTAGTRYAFNLDGYDTSSSYSLRDPYLQLLDHSGNVVAASDDISASNWSSKIDYTAATGGTYYLVAQSSPSDGTYTTGNYQIRSSVTSAPSPAIALSADKSSQTAPTIVPLASGDQTLTATPGPEIFDFGSLAFGKDTIVGFNPAQDLLRLSSSLAGDFATASADMSETATGGTLIALDRTHSITLDGVAPASLSAANFHFV
jgi:autotransporter passenger strand-loop-strand repeat protein